jgi:hypothetical protein
MEREGVEQKFMLYGDMMVGGTLIKNGSPEQARYWKDKIVRRCPEPL